MLAALKLRLLEARRRGGPLLLCVGIVVVGWVAVAGGETPDGRYGLATDLATTFGYLAAVFFGAFPLAGDRERKRSYLPSASPVAPWSWALGNAVGAALLGWTSAFVLLLVAGLGTALGGGIDTHETTRMGLHGTKYLPRPADNPEGGVRIEVPKTTTSMRLTPRVHLVVEETVGATDSATVEVDGVRYEFYPNQPIVVPVKSRFVLIRSLSNDHLVGLALAETRALIGERPFLLNAIGAALAPAVATAAVAAVATAASANLTAPVAALLTTLLLILASLKGFMREMFEHEGTTQAAVHDDGHGHEQHTEVNAGMRAFAKPIVTAALAVLPDVNELDRTDRVAIGEWTGARQSGRALILLAIALALAAALGGIGVHARRLP